MNEWITRASRWQLALVMGLTCGVGAGLFVAVVGGEDWGGVLPAAIGTAVGGGLLGATLMYGQVQRETEAVGALPVSDRRAARRASLRGPAPEDPETRAAAYALAQTALADHRRRRVLGALSGLFVLAMLVNLAVQASPWWWLGVAAFVGSLGYGWFVFPRQLRRRAELLRP